MLRPLGSAALAAVVLAGKPIAQDATAYMPYADARPVLDALADILPPELKTPGDSVELAWRTWAEQHDGVIRARLARGDEDTLVNWLLFGTSFTKLSRVDLEAPVNATASTALASLIARRTTELVAFLAGSADEERPAFARRVLARSGQRVDTAAAREVARAFLIKEVARVAREQRELAEELAAARKRGDVTEELATRSRLFRSRGLSLDTSLAPNLAVEQSLSAMAAQGLLPRGQIRRVALIGPGLDFSDKLAGLDFYPVQTLQPFALVDTLARLGLGSPEALEVTTIDVSPRVGEHLNRAIANAQRGAPYVLQLPLDESKPWRVELRAYWKTVGSSIGADVRPLTVPPELREVTSRAIRIPPAVVSIIHPVDLNIVVQRLAGRAFDLAVATNVFVYYDLLDQSLALRNVAAMLRSGGFLLTNNALLELPGSPLMSVGYLTTQYSDRPDDGDHIVWYQAK